MYDTSACKYICVYIYIQHMTKQFARQYKTGPKYAFYTQTFGLMIQIPSICPYIADLDLLCLPLGPWDNFKQSFHVLDY